MLTRDLILERLQNLGYDLPEVPAAAANYVPFVISGSQLHIAGQIPFLNGEHMYQGRLGDDFSVEQGQKSARACALNILAQVDAALDGQWEKVERCLKLGGFVQSTPEFADHPLVINGASDVIGEVMGDKGQHARFAVGVTALPFGVATEINALFAIRAS